MMKRRIVSLIPTIISGLIPLVGVFVYKWEPFNVFFYYWLEILIIGAILPLKYKNACGPKLVLRAKDSSLNLKNYLVSFWIFAILTGAFLLFVFGPTKEVRNANYSAVIPLINPVAILWSVVYLSARHILAYKVEFINDRGYTKVSPQAIAEQGLAAIIPLFIAIFIAVFIFNSPTALGFMVAFVIVKTSFDLFKQLNENRFSMDKIADKYSYEGVREYVIVLRERFNEDEKIKKFLVKKGFEVKLIEKALAEAPPAKILRQHFRRRIMKHAYWFIVVSAIGVAIRVYFAYFKVISG